MAKLDENLSPRHQKKMSLLSYLSKEVTRGYVLDHDEERYTTRRQKMYTFMKIPRELEKFMSYGFFHCLDSFLFVFTFLPIRFFLAICALVVRAPLVFLGLLRPQHGRLLFPAEKIDLLKGLIIAICAYVLSHVDTSMMYHLIKSQSVIKLYLFYNMLEVGDRLFSAFGQDTIDALFWTATEPTLRKREHIGVIPHFLLTITYVILHTLLVLLQATTLNVAINASNKALLTIMMSNNFVELKGSVFKKFDKDNLFQVSCSDVRERFHLFSLLFIVVVQTMKEYGWKEESFLSLAPDCLLVLFAEFLVDWIKHAFITRFNEVSAEVYKDYTTYLAYDLAQTKQKHAFSDHSDIVSRRMGFIPLPLGVVMIRVISNAVRVNSRGAPVIFLLAYLCLLTFRILASIVILGKACDLIDHHQHTKTNSSASPQKRKTSHEKNPNKHVSTTADEVPVTQKERNEPVETQEDDESETVEALIEEYTQPFNVTLEENLDVNGKISPALSCPTDDLFEKLEAISKSSSVILEEEEDLDVDDVHKVNGGSDTDDDNQSKTAIQHRWSNSRANMFVARGELNKSVYTTSRKRPLSCTPPSTSISTSASIEEDDEGKSQAFHVPEMESQLVDLSQPAQTVPIFLPDLIQPVQSHQQHSPVPSENDFLATAEMSLHPSPEEVLNLSSREQKTDPPVEEIRAVKVNDDCLLFQANIGQRSMSSPDFLLQYQSPYDEERDWPLVDREDDTLELEPLLLNERLLHHKDTPDGQTISSKQAVMPRRGSGCAADDFRVLRNRKRFDTDRL